MNKRAIDGLSYTGKVVLSYEEQFKKNALVI